MWVQLRPKPWFHLDEIYAAICDGLTYEEIERDHKEEFELRNNDKLAYRYPRSGLVEAVILLTCAIEVIAIWT